MGCVAEAAHEFSRFNTGKSWSKNVEKKSEQGCPSSKTIRERNRHDAD